MDRVALWGFVGVVWTSLVGCDALMGPQATITDPDSPNYDRPCPLEQYREYPSDLIADCRCGTNQAPTQGIPECQRPYNLSLEGYSIGEGPSFAGVYNAEYLGGFLDESEGSEGTLYIAVGYGGSTDRSGSVLAIDVATGDRRVVSGDLLDPSGVQLVGSGPLLQTVLDVRAHPDGNLYAWVRTTPPTQQELYRIDRDTGDRTLVWKGRTAPYPQCADASAGVLQYTDFGFAIDDDGFFYVPHGTIDVGSGIVRLSPDLDSCEILTGAGASASSSRGDGPGMGGFVAGFTILGDQLIASSTAPKFFASVDLETGDRVGIFEPWGVTPPERWSIWDEERGVWWFAGFQNSVSIYAYDPETGVSGSIFDGGTFEWMPLGAAGPIQINSLNYAPVFLRSNGNLLVAQDGFSIVEYEPSTGNSVIISL